MSLQSDVLVIGAGPAGLAVAITLAQAGQRVLLVDALGEKAFAEDSVSTLSLRTPAQRLREIRLAGEIGLCLPSVDFDADWSRIQRRRQETLESRNAEWLERLHSLPAREFVAGWAMFTGPRQALIRAEDGRLETVAFERAVVATGAVEKRPDIPGIDHHRVLTPQQALSLPQRPASLTVLGGSASGVELAQIFHAYGSQVTLIETRPTLLAGWDTEISELIRKRMSIEGIEIERSARLQRISNTGGGVFVEYQDRLDQPRHHLTEYVVLAMGREPALGDLGLDSAGVEFDRHGVVVDGELGSRNGAIHAVGDAAGHAVTARFAWQQGRALARRLLGEPVELPDPAQDCAVLGSFPEIGRAGLTEEQAEMEGIGFGVVRYDLSRHYHAHLCGEQNGLLKLLYRHGHRSIVGIHAIGDGCSELMSLAAVVLRAGVTLDTLATAVTPQATLGEALSRAAALVPEGL